MLYCGLSRTCTTAGCGSPYYYVARYLNPNTTTGTDELEMAGSFSLYPVPFSDRLVIDSDSITVFEVSDALGRTIESGKVDRVRVVDTSLWPSGMYVVRTSIGAKLVVKTDR